MPSPIRVIPTQANAIRAAAKANPDLDKRELAARLGIHWHLVDLALSKGDRRRIKSVATQRLDTGTRGPGARAPKS